MCVPYSGDYTRQKPALTRQSSCAPSPNVAGKRVVTPTSSRGPLKETGLAIRNNGIVTRLRWTIPVGRTTRSLLRRTSLGRMRTNPRADKGFRRSVPTVGSDGRCDGRFRRSVPTVGSDGGFRRWVPTVGSDGRFRRWVPTVGSDGGFR